MDRDSEQCGDRVSELEDSANIGDQEFRDTLRTITTA